MAIAFQCHQCGGKFAAPDHLAGKQARCQRCNAVITVPAAASALDDPFAGPLGDPLGSPLRSTAPTLRPAVSARSGASVPWGLIVTIGGLLAFLGGGALCLVVFVRTMWPAAPAIPNRPPLAAAPRPGAGPPRPAPSAPAPPPPPAEKSTQPMPPAANASANSSATDSGSPPAGGAPGLPNLPAAGGRRPKADEQPAPPPPPAVSWAAKADPPAAPVAYKQGKIAIVLPSSAELRLPHGPSHFILGLAHEVQKDIREVIDLRTGKGIGKPLVAKLQYNYQSDAFSPDGRYLAAVQLREGEEVPIGVWSFITGLPERVLKVEATRISGPLRFGAAHQLVSLHDKDFKLSVLTLWNLQTGEKLREFAFSNMETEVRPRPESLAVSPGGKYAALVLGQQLGVFELATGQPAGNVLLPVRPSSCEGAMFSPDGAELALLVNSSSGHRLLVVEFATGRITVDHDYRGTLQHYTYEGPPLDWLPDKSGLVFRGHILLERTTGEEVWYFPTTDTSPRRFIRDNEILVLMRDRNQKVLRTFDLPDKEIAKAMQAVREGGAAVDSVLPPLTTPDLFGATAQTLPSGQTQWSLVPDAAGKPPRRSENDVLVAKHGEIVHRVMFAGPASGKVVVQKEITPPPGPGRRPDRQVVIERFDVTTGQGGNALPVAHVYQLADVSPSGKFAVVAFAPQAHKFDRLDVLSLAPKKHVAAWRPYAGEKDPPAAEGARPPRFPTLFGMPNDPRLIAWISMLDDEHLLTVNTAGKLICWKLPECKALYSFAEFGEPLAVSAGRKYLAGGHSGEFRVFDAASGACVGDLESPLLGSRAIRGAFRSDGQELSAVIDALTDRMLVRWDLKTGKLKQEIPIPALAVSSLSPFASAFTDERLGLEYRGPNFLMVDDQFLVDLEKRAVVWRYHLPLGHYAANPPDDRTWYCVFKNSATDLSLFLTSLDTPSTAVQQKALSQSLERQLVLYPGMSVKVAVDLSAANVGDLAPTVEKAVAQGLESRGLKIDSSAPLTFSVVAAQRSTGEQIQVYDGRSPFRYSPFLRPGQPKETISQEELACRLSISDSSGKVLWYLDRSARMRDFGSVRTENAGQELRSEMVKRFESVLAGTGTAATAMPRYIFADFNTILAGESQLGFHLEAPPPQSQLPAARQPPGITPGS